MTPEQEARYAPPRSYITLRKYPSHPDWYYPDTLKAFFMMRLIGWKDSTLIKDLEKDGNKLAAMAEPFGWNIEYLL